MQSATKSKWDGKHIDDPPEGLFNPLSSHYSSGFDVFNYVSFLAWEDVEMEANLEM
jgi:hypothetical protein